LAGGEEGAGVFHGLRRMAGEGGIHEVNAAGGAFLFGKVVARFGLGCKRGVEGWGWIHENPPPRAESGWG
jgi:hypothetical protein